MYNLFAGVAGVVCYSHLARPAGEIVSIMVVGGPRARR